MSSPTKLAHDFIQALSDAHKDGVPPEAVAYSIHDLIHTRDNNPKAVKYIIEWIDPTIVKVLADHALASNKVAESLNLPEEEMADLVQREILKNNSETAQRYRAGLAEVKFGSNDI